MLQAEDNEIPTRVGPGAQRTATFSGAADFVSQDLMVTESTGAGHHLKETPPIPLRGGTRRA